MKLLYRGSRDSFLASAFHTKCDKVGPTLSLVRDTNNNTFGGVTYQNFTNIHIWMTDTDAFVFNLNRKEKY